jgi:F-type H+-transporting ATPase subunit gamma
MPSLKAIRRRITSVKNTQKITKAMKLVAAARLRKAQQRAQDLRPYARKVTEVLGNVAAAVGDLGDETPPLLREREVKSVLLLVLTSDRGLAGAYNANVQRTADRRIRELQSELPDGGQVVLATIGRKGRDYLRRRRLEITHDFTGAYEGGAARASEIARQLVSEFEEGKYDRVEIIFTEFKSAISQKVTTEQLMPVKPSGGSEGGGDFIYEPDRNALLERLLPMYVETMLYRAMLESVASEHGARMTAMDNATKNAKQMIGSLTLQYNRARQAAITKELMEIIGGAEALKG